MKSKITFLVLSLILSATVSAQITNDGVNSVTIGDYDNPGDEAFDGFNLQNSPVIWPYTYSGSQVLYNVEDLQAMAGKDITAVKFKYYSSNYATTDYTSQMTIYLSETDNPAFPYNADAEKHEWIDFDASNPVTTISFTADFQTMASEDGAGELVFDLSDSPFRYTGKDLLVTVVNEAAAYLDPSGGSVCFYSFYPEPRGTGAPYRTLVYGSDTKDFLTNQLKNKTVDLTDNENKWKDYPVTKFEYKELTTNIPALAQDVIPEVYSKNKTVYINYNTDASGRLSLYRIDGTLIRTMDINLKNSSFDVSDSGIYVLKINDFATKLVIK